MKLVAVLVWGCVALVACVTIYAEATRRPTAPIGPEPPPTRTVSTPDRP